MKLRPFQRAGWTRILPPLTWLAEYKPSWLRHDAIAGVTLASYAIPVSLAYAGLAGLPPQVGIYGYLLGGIGYALLGSSRQLAVGPDLRNLAYDRRRRRIPGRRRRDTIRADRQSFGMRCGAALP